MEALDGDYSNSNDEEGERVKVLPLKRSKWESDSHDQDQVDELEAQAIEARAKAAAKAARQRAKAAQRSKKLQEESNSTPRAGSSSTTTDNTAPSTPLRQLQQATTTTKSNTTSRSNVLPVPPRSWHPTIQGCRSIHCYERLNHIEEGSYGVVFRAREKYTGDIVALKKLKMDKEKNGFPITSLREIRTLMEAAHENVVRVREIVVGDTLTQIFIVMDFIEHDLKTLLSTQTMPFLASEIKTLLHQLLSAMSLLHRNWIIHRDLKTSNLLMNNRGQLKLADFGLARMYGEPRGEMTQLVVTLWYRLVKLTPALLAWAFELTLPSSPIISSL
jgi:cell division cycle 2-like protein